MTVEIIPALTAAHLLHLAVGSRVRWHDSRIHFGRVHPEQPPNRLAVIEEGSGRVVVLDTGLTHVFPLGRAS